MTYYTYSATDLLLSVTEDKNIIELNTYDAENIRSSGRTLTSAGEGNVTSLETFVTLSGTLLSEIHTEKASDTMLTGSLGTTVTTRNLVYGNGLETIGYTYAITNSHGEVKKLVDTSGNVLYSYVYDAFGNLLSAVTGTATTGTGSASAFSSLTDVISGTLTFVNDILYASERYDSVTDTYYLRARNYAPDLGRFTCEDAYLGDGRNLYTYVSNNPLRFVDPSGYCKSTVVETLQTVSEAANTVKWGLRIGKTIIGVVCLATGVGAGVGAALLTSVAIDIASEVAVDAVVSIADACGADERTKAEVANWASIGVGVVEIVASPTSAASGYSLVGSGVGGLIGGSVAETVYETVTGEDGTLAYEIGSAVGSIAGSVATAKAYTNLQTQNAVATTPGTKSAGYYTGGGESKGGNGKSSGNLTEGSRKTDFYVTPNGEVVPSTGYRYMNSKYAEQTMETMSALGSYFGFEKFDSASAAQDAFQIAPNWSDCKLRGEFDTLQVIDDMYVPKAYGGNGPGLEPFTRCYPEYGKGGYHNLNMME